MKEIVKAIYELVSAINKPRDSPWLNQKEAAEYARLNVKTFVKLVDQNAMPVHSFYGLGIAKELFNKNEIDTALMKL
jgi:hypothetical protein